MIDAFIDQIRNDLGIPVATNDSEQTQMMRILYSAIGRTALASLYDATDSDGSVSITHFKSRIEEQCDAYFSIYPSLGILHDQKDIIVEQIYNIYYQNGFYYHKNMRIASAKFIEAKGQHIKFLRAIIPLMKANMSGLGFYSVENNDSNLSPYEEAFGLIKKTYEEIYQYILQTTKWIELSEFPSSIEFLSTNLKYQHQYWKKTPDNNGLISIARYGDKYRIYIFYRYYDGKYQQSRIPEWQIVDYMAGSTSCFGVYKYASAILFHEQCLPPIKVWNSEALIKIQIGYLLPPEEYHFFHLYSWPSNISSEQKLASLFDGRDMLPSVFAEYKLHLQKLGYQVEEH